MARVKQEALDQAKIALHNFRSMQPTLNAYVRVLTGRADARVEASATSNGSTDGKTIYYRPPLSLGKKLTHQRMRCDLRDEHRLMRCAACGQRESVLVTMYHEIAHIWFNSFPGIGETDKELAIREAINELGSEYGKALRGRLITRGSRLGYMELARYVSPFLPMLLNCLEDARVNRALFQALPGVEIMFDADTARIFREGVEHMGAKGSWTRTQWRDRPLNAQAMIGVFCMASGYDFDTWLHEFVVKDLKDPALVKLVTPLQHAMDISSIFKASILVLARLRELGYCRTESDPKDDFVPPYREPEPESEDDGISEDPDNPWPDEYDDEDSDDADESEASAAPGGDAEDASEGEDDEEGSSDGGDPEGSADDDGSDESDERDPEDDVLAEERDEVDGDDESRDDSDVGGTGGRETGDAGADGESDGDGDSSATADAESEGSGSAGGEVSEEDLADSESGAGTPGGPSGPGDGEGTGAGGLDGLHDSDRGDEDGDRPGSSPDDSGLESDPAGSEDGGDEHGEGLPEGLPVRPDLPWGEASELEGELDEVGGHESGPGETHSHADGTSHSHGDDDDEAVVAALVAGEWFEKPSASVTDVKIRKGDFFLHDSSNDYVRRGSRRTKVILDPPESVIGPALLRARVVFAANARGKYETNLKHGRIHTPSMARKVPAGEVDFFQQRRLPGRRSFFVGIGIDASGSTGGGMLTLAKQVAFAEAELLSRLGIKFYMYAHSGSGYSSYSLDLYEIKGADEPWNDLTRMRLRHMGSKTANLDGHSIQAYRKMLQKRRETTKILHYYSDGSMPCENYSEELQILREEIIRFRRERMILAGVGINTNAPQQHGLPTVIVERQEDVIKVVEDLEQYITVR